MTPTDAPLAASLTADPYTSLAVHYGMLLGVPDFQVLAANPRGKHQLHQAWQHGKGVIWGFGVEVRPDSAELVVRPGLAVDGLGREVASDADLCLDVRAWLEERKKKGFEPRGDAGRQEFAARLVLRHAACLSRPVPSIGSTCGPATDSVEFSRVLEIADLELVPYEPVPDTCGRPAGWRPPPDERDATFPALRALVRDRVLPDDLPVPPEGWLAAFRAVAAVEAAAMGPPGLVPRPSERTRLFPEDEPGELLLADLPYVVLEKLPAGTWRLTADPIDLSVRRTHVPTWVIEELAAELLAGIVGGRPDGDAGGPRVTRTRLSLADQLAIDVDQRVVAGTVRAALELRAFDRSAAEPAWSDPIPVEPAVEQRADGTSARIRVDLPAPPTADLTYRLVLRGTGPTPLLGLAGGRPVPLAGLRGGPAGSIVDGHDVVVVLTQEDIP